jgi:DNA helicase-2/ATP-dependent DNA helicase PcrA
VRGLVERNTGSSPENIALLSTLGRGVAVISNALTTGATAIPHSVLFDETATLLSSRLLAFLLEPKHPSSREADLAQAYRYLALKLRAGGTGSKLIAAKKLELLAEDILQGKRIRKTKLYSGLCTLYDELEKIKFSGVPPKDWMMLRGLLRNSATAELLSVDADLNYLVTFNRGKRIASGLAASWEENACYMNAREVLDSTLAEDQILSGIGELKGIHVMTIHKSKGKQFDAVIIFQNQYFSPFIWRDDKPPYLRSRRILRVAVTRARFHTLILNEAFPKCPILSAYNLDSGFA